MVQGTSTLLTSLWRPVEVNFVWACLDPIVSMKRQLVTLKANKCTTIKTVFVKKKSDVCCPRARQPSVSRVFMVHSWLMKLVKTLLVSPSCKLDQGIFILFYRIEAKSAKSNLKTVQVMPANRDNFRFTVEQIWLLQRLRNAGLSRDQIIAGLEDLDRLDGAGSASNTFSAFQSRKLTSSSSRIELYAYCFWCDFFSRITTYSALPTTRPHSNGSDQSKSPTEAVEAEKIPTTPVSRAAQPPKFDPVLQVSVQLVFFLVNIFAEKSESSGSSYAKPVGEASNSKSLFNVASWQPLLGPGPFQSSCWR